MKQDIKKKVLRRLKIIEGQVRGLQKMVKDEKYCIDIITQVSAVRNAFSSVEDLMLENHLKTHVAHQMNGKDSIKAITEILKVFKKGKNRNNI